MAHKYYLQEVLFNKTNKLKEPRVIINLRHQLSSTYKLWQIATVQKAQVCHVCTHNIQLASCRYKLKHMHIRIFILQMEEDGKSCIKFTPLQYSYVTRFEKSRLPRTQQQGKLFRHHQTIRSCTR